jgi:membrane protease YdiL (CAAX protease family)
MVRQPTWQRIILLIVLGYEALGGLSGGSFLVAAPDGRLMNMPVEILHGFFPDFLIPGLILIGMGLLTSVAFVAVWRRSRLDWLLAGLALGGFTIWFLVEIAIIGLVPWVHAMWGLPVLIGGLMALPLIPSGASGATEEKAFIKLHPVLTYYALAFLIGWGGILLVIATQAGLPRTEEEFAGQLPLMIPAMLAGPSLAGILMTALVSGKAGFREMLSRLLIWRVSARWYAAALLIAPIVFVVVQMGLSLTSPVYLPGLITVTDRVPFVLMGILAALGVGFCEELGWTGFAIPRLRLRYGLVGTGLIAGVLWAAWHSLATVVWPSVALADGLTQPLYIALGLFTLLFGQLTAFRVLMLWVYDRTGSLLVAMLMHASLDACSFILGPVSAASGSTGVVYGFALGAAWWIVVAAVILVNRGQLWRRPLGKILSVPELSRKQAA